MKSPPSAIAAAISACALAVILCAQPAAAAVIMSLPDGVARDIPKGLKITNQPISFADGVTYRVTTPAGIPTSSHFGGTGTYSFANSGQWSGTPFAAFGLQTAVMSFSFDDPVAAALAEFNWGRPSASSAGPITFRAFNSAGALLEKLTFNAADPAYLTGYYGFQRASNDISRFEVEGYYLGARNLSTLTSTVSAVPEPSTWAMMIIGVGGVGAVARHARRKGAPAIA